jgi:hypothetical protein
VPLDSAGRQITREQKEQAMKKAGLKPVNRPRSRRRRIQR